MQTGTAIVVSVAVLAAAGLAVVYLQRKPAPAPLVIPRPSLQSTSGLGTQVERVSGAVGTLVGAGRDVSKLFGRIF